MRDYTIDPLWDLFICHASEDKDEVARPLAEALRDKGLKVWYDEFTLTLSDILNRSIDYGLANSRFGVVILSPSFFKKEWPRRELDGLTAKESTGKVILPIWHKVNREYVARFSPTLAAKLAISTSQGLKKIFDEILKVIEKQKSIQITKERPERKIPSEKKVSRRKYLKYAQASIIIVAAIGAGSYYATRPGPTPTPTLTPIIPTPTPVSTQTPTLSKLPFEGVTINVAYLTLKTWEANYWKDEFKNRTGISIQIIEIPSEEMHERYLVDFISKTGNYDVVQFDNSLSGDFFSMGYCEPVESLAEKWNLDLSLEDYFDIFINYYCSWEGTLFGMCNDGEVHLLFYKKDIFEDLNEKDEFKNLYGYDLNPPQTWEEYMDISEFFYS